MPENSRQARAIVNLRLALRYHFGQTPNLVLEGNMFVYTKEGDPTACCAPDVFVLRDRRMRDPLSGRQCPVDEECREQLEASEAKAAAEAEARRRAEARIAELEAQLRQVRNPVGEDS